MNKKTAKKIRSLVASHAAHTLTMALDIPCPYCSAKQGWECQTASGFLTGTPHRARVVAARDASHAVVKVAWGKAADDLFDRSWRGAASWAPTSLDITLASGGRLTYHDKREGDEGTFTCTVWGVSGLSWPERKLTIITTDEIAEAFGCDPRPVYLNPHSTKPVDLLALDDRALKMVFRTIQLCGEGFSLSVIRHGVAGADLSAVDAAGWCRVNTAINLDLKAREDEARKLEAEAKADLAAELAA